MRGITLAAGRLHEASQFDREFSVSRFTGARLCAGSSNREWCSVVVSITPQARYVHSLSSLNDLFQFALDTHYDIVSITQVELSARVATDSGAGQGEKWPLVVGVRRKEKGEAAIRHVHSYAAPRAKVFVKDLKRCVGPFYAFLENKMAEEVQDVCQDIFGAVMGATMAAHFNCAPDTIATCAFRRYITQQGTLIASYNWRPAEQFYCRMKMSRAL